MTQARTSDLFAASAADAPPLLPSDASPKPLTADDLHMAKHGGIEPRRPVSPGDRIGVHTLLDPIGYKTDKSGRRYSRWRARCVCGAVEILSLTAVRNRRKCAHFKADPGEPLIDSVTPYAEDDRAWFVTMCHPDGITLEHCGELIGVTRERVRQIEDRALAKIAKKHPKLLDVLRAKAEARDARIRSLPPPPPEFTKREADNMTAKPGAAYARVLTDFDKSAAKNWGRPTRRVLPDKGGE